MQKVPGIEMHLDFSKKGDNNMKKVKLTQEQADLIEGYKKRGISDALKFIEAFSVQNRFVLLSNQCLNSLAVEELSICLLVSDSYEVIPDEFFEGDWIVTKSGYVGQIEFINVEESWANIGYSKDTKLRGVCLAKTFNLSEIERYATSKEIQQEKKRRFWNGIGRKEDEYLVGDLVKETENDWDDLGIVKYETEHGKFNVYFYRFGGRKVLAKHEIRLVVKPEDRLDK